MQAADRVTLDVERYVCSVVDFQNCVACAIDERETLRESIILVHPPGIT